MPHYKRFIFKDYLFHSKLQTIQLQYSLDDKLDFREIVDLSGIDIQSYDPAALDQALFALHLAGGASYYKAFCPKTIEVRSGSLTPGQADFWNKLYTQGLGEFFYRNQMDFRGLVNFPASDSSALRAASTAASAPPYQAIHRALVPFGGGKDSTVSAELLRHNNISQTLFRVRPHPIITQLAATANLPLLEVVRRLDPQLFELNKQGALNGHVPITAYISFLSIVVALLGGYDSVFFSNERSSSYGNVEYLGLQVNHQWSKSLEAEIMVRDYIATYVTPKVQYLNLLRPLSELHIAKMFAEHPQYFAQATSCNTNWGILHHDPRQHRWCGHCPKCAFSFALLAAYLPAGTLVPVFQKNLFEDQQLLGLYRQLWGVEGFKPLECVGTPEETKAAFYLACQQPEYAQTVIGRHFTQHILPGMHEPEALVAGLLKPDFAGTLATTRELLERALANQLISEP